MTLGEKIREARKRCGVSQEQLAEKMSVSRSAIAKWETDKGLPDVGNLKMLARLLGTSVDQLLDEGEDPGEAVIREAYSLANYGQGCKKVKKDRVMRDKFPDARIYPLYAQQDFCNREAPMDHPMDCSARSQGQHASADCAFYLVEKEQRQLLVTVTDYFVEIRLLDRHPCGNQFYINGWNFIKSNYEIIG